jgi:hypothetical protein
MITKDEVISHKDFALLEEYLDSMYPDRYEFRDTELLIYYPEVTIKNLVGDTYTIYDVFIHYGYNEKMFSFTKLRYTVSDYVNQSNSTFTHSHLAKDRIAFKMNGYCYGKLNIFYDFNNIESLIAVINVTDFWLHNENSSDCYTPISSLFYNNGEDSLSSLKFKRDVVTELESCMIKNKEIKKTIFGDLTTIEWDDEAILNALTTHVKDKQLFLAQNLKNIIDKYQDYIVNFKDIDYYITVEGFNGEHLKSNTKSNVNDNVVQQLKQMAIAITSTNSFLPNLERYYFNS